MANDGFTQKQLEQLGQVVELVVDAKIKPINDRLDLIEQDIKAIKNCPTIQKEIKEDQLNKNKILWLLLAIVSKFYNTFTSVFLF